MSPVAARLLLLSAVSLFALGCGSRNLGGTTDGLGPTAPTGGDPGGGGGGDAERCGGLLTGAADYDLTPGTAEAQAQEACEGYVQGLCEYIYGSAGCSCGCYCGQALQAIENTYGFSGRLGCTLFFEAAACSDLYVGAPIREGRQIIDQGSYTNCRLSIDNADCMPFDDFLVHPGIERACEQAPKGTVAEGDACELSGDCAAFDGYCNDQDECESRSGEEYEQTCADDLECPSDVCLLYVPNAQSVTGSCSRFCNSHPECGLGASCVDVAGTNLCLSRCLTNGECGGSLVCVVPPGHAVGICSVEAI